MADEDLLEAIGQYLAKIEQLEALVRQVETTRMRPELVKLEATLVKYTAVIEANREHLRKHGQYYLMLGKVAQCEAALRKAKGYTPRQRLNSRWAFTLPWQEPATKTAAQQNSGHGAVRGLLYETDRDDRMRLVGGIDCFVDE